MSDDRKVYLIKWRTDQLELGTHVMTASIEEVRHIGMTSKALELPHGDSFSVHLENGDAVEGWVKEGDTWRQIRV